MKVYGISVHGHWTDEKGRVHEMPYGISGRDKIYSDIEVARKQIEEKVIPECDAWKISRRIGDSVYMRSRNAKYENDVLIISIVTLYLDENDD